MALSTCFLPHFPRTLQGRAKTAATSRVVSESQKLRDLALPDLAAVLGGLLPVNFFAKVPDAKARRERLYPPVTLFWAFLFQVLTRGTSAANHFMRCARRSEDLQKVLS